MTTPTTQNDRRFINTISAAANIYRVTKDDATYELVLVDNCHMGRNMQAIFRAFRDLGCDVQLANDLPDRGQGFIDESGVYHNRSEAYVIAKASGQPFNDDYTLPDNKLDSSCIRHFDADKTIADYIPIDVTCECGENAYVYSEQRSYGTIYECMRCGTEQLKVSLVEAGLL